MDLDAADWPETFALRAPFLQLDEAASCAICHEAFNVPLALPCGHSFCAECIRSNVEYQERSAPARCPQCRERCDARHLHHNLALQSIVNAWMVARSGLKQLATAPPSAKYGEPGTQTRSRAAAARGPCQGNNARGRARQNTQQDASAPSQPPSSQLKRKHPEPSSSSSQSQSQSPAAQSSQSCLESDYRPSQRALSAASAVINDHLDRCLQNHVNTADADPAPAAAAVNARGAARQGNNARKAQLQEMEQRYTRFRVAVQTALDGGEGHLGYSEVARRLVARDKQAAVAGLPSHVMPKANRSSDPGGGFTELIQATKARKASAASAGAGRPALHDLTGDDRPSGAIDPRHCASNSSGEEMRCVGWQTDTQSSL
ncbi:hypothetical protein WJX73_002372 [Symbiochloris irregularis]|uniref:RING-type domain-containing protein n=1 Tax=Symbiochloris irregularis TaxID=706552 RepID=A0AAW1NNM8_9CHLO